MAKRVRGMSLNLDSFIDILTCLVGLLVLIIIMTGIDAAQIKVLIPTPIESPTDKRPIFIECRNNQLFHIPVEQINQMASDELRKIAEQVRGDTNLLLDRLKDAQVETDSYTVDLTYTLLAQFALRPKPNAQGYELKDIQSEKPTDWFGQIVSRVNKDEELITFLVRDDSYSVFKRARALAWLQKINVSYELLDVKDAIKFGLGGTPSLAQ
jgi:hypothetical protein